MGITLQISYWDKEASVYDILIQILEHSEERQINVLLREEVTLRVTMTGMGYMRGFWGAGYAGCVDLDGGYRGLFVL